MFEVAFFRRATTFNGLLMHWVKVLKMMIRRLKWLVVRVVVGKMIILVYLLTMVVITSISVG